MQNNHKRNHSHSHSHHNHNHNHNHGHGHSHIHRKNSSNTGALDEKQYFCGKHCGKCHNSHKKRLNTNSLMKEDLVMAIAGNPNCGKTVIFNSLTGGRQHVGNWPGVTVEKKEGSFYYKDKLVKVVDLPGTYSLDASSEDEKVARDFIVNSKPDLVLNVIDATNIERNLYLSLQLLELGARVIIALNMYDEALNRNISIDNKKLSELLGVPVIPTVATKNKGIYEILDSIAAIPEYNKDHGSNTEKGNSVKEDTGNSLKKETGNLVKEETGNSVKEETGNSLKEETGNSLKEETGNYGLELTKKRYDLIGRIMEKVVKYSDANENKKTISDRIDAIATNKFLGIPVFLFIMWLIFQFTFTLGEPFTNLIEKLFIIIGERAGSLFNLLAIPVLIKSLVVDGIIGGVGSVIVFIPNIFFLFIAISLLEDSGYMARAAHITDKFMHVLGLHGKSFIPMIVGFGCNVPGVMASRTLDNKKDRMITILINPLMSCSARLPIYVLFTGVFFAGNQGLVIFSLYLSGIILAIVMGMIFKKTLFKGETSHFIMELPPYRIPSLKSTFVNTWEKTSSFLYKAGTLIVAVVVIVWILSNLPPGTQYAGENSLLGRLGSIIAPLLVPAGFGTWQASVSLLFGIVAKEVVVGTMGVVYGAGKEGMEVVIASNWTALSACSFMVMSLIYIPCIATIGAIRRETNSWKWTLFAICYSLILGWTMSVIVYQTGRLLGF